MTVIAPAADLPADEPALTTGASMAANQARRADPLFLPDHFFLGRSGGHGIDRDPFGRIVRRCVIDTHGARHRNRDAICVDETLQYDDGEIQTWRWVLGRADNGRFLIAELQAGSGHIAMQGAGGDFVFSFRRRRRLLSVRHRTRFTMLSDDVALETTWVTLLGAPRLHFTAVRRRGEPPKSTPHHDHGAVDLMHGPAQAAADVRLAQVA